MAHPLKGANIADRCRMARQQGLHALRNNQDLARFVIEGESNGRQLGTGSYGSVEEVSISQLANYILNLLPPGPSFVDNK